MQKLNPSTLPSTWNDLEVHVKESSWYAEILPLRSLHYASNLKRQGSIPTSRMRKPGARDNLRGKQQLDFQRLMCEAQPHQLPCPHPSLLPCCLWAAPNRSCSCQRLLSVPAVLSRGLCALLLHDGGSFISEAQVPSPPSVPPSILISLLQPLPADNSGSPALC